MRTERVTAHLSVFATIAESIRAIASHWRTWSRLLLMPMVITTILLGAEQWVLLGVAKLYFASPPLDHEAAVLRLAFAMSATVIAYRLLYGIPLTMFLVAWHRALLLGPEVPQDWRPSWHRRHWRYLVRFIGLVVVASAPGIILLGVAGMVGLGTVLVFFWNTAGHNPWISYLIAGLAFLFAVYVTARLGILLPAAAIDQPLSVAAAWRATRRHVWRLIVSLILVTIPLVFVSSLLSWAVETPCVNYPGTHTMQDGVIDLGAMDCSPNFLERWVFAAFTYFEAGVMLTLLSLAFQQMIEPPTRASESNPAP